MKKLFLITSILLVSCNVKKNNIDVQLYLCNHDQYSELCVKVSNNGSRDIFISNLKGMSSFINVNLYEKRLLKNITDSFFSMSIYNTIHKDDSLCCIDNISFDFLNEAEKESLIKTIKSNYDRNVLSKFNKGEIEIFLGPRVDELVFLKAKQVYSESYLINNDDFRGKSLIFSFKYPQKMPFEKDSLFIKDFFELNNYILPEVIKGFSKYKEEIISDTLIYEFE